MRVIAGAAGGLRLVTPKQGVRPTMDRVKAAIFSSLGNAVIDARVLDLFAGAGGLGIEALSRGAASAVFVEQNRSAAEAIERNLETTRLQGRVVRDDVFRYLRRAAGRETFDLIFADPPYDVAKGDASFTQRLLHAPELSGLLHGTGYFVLEKRPGEALPATDAWQFKSRRKYGATEVLIVRPIPAARP